MSEEKAGLSRPRHMQPVGRTYPVSCLEKEVAVRREEEEADKIDLLEDGLSEREHVTPVTVQTAGSINCI